VAQIITRVLQFLKSIIISTYYGFGKLNDVYLYSSNVFGGLQGLFIDALSAGLIPFFAQKKTAQDKEKFLTSVLITLVSLLVAFNLVFLLALPYIQPWIAPGFEDPQNHWHLFIFLIIFSFNSCLLMVERIGEAYLHSEKVFALPQFASTAGMIFNILLLILFLKSNYYMLALSTLAGTFVSLIIVSQFIKVRWHGFDADVWKLFAFSIPLILTGGLGMISIAIDRSFATNLPEGTVSTLSYAFLLVSSATGVFSQVMSKASFSYLSHMSESPQEVNKQVKRIYFAYILGFIIISLGFIAIGREVFEWIFLRGRVNANDFHELLVQFVIYYPLMIIMSLGTIILQVFYINKHSRWPNIINGFFALLNVLLNFLWVPILGAYGLSLSTLFIGLSALLCQLLIAHKKYQLACPKASWIMSIAMIYGGMVASLFFPAVIPRLLTILLTGMLSVLLLRKDLYHAFTPGFRR
jgi:putative peptidoglycan lipid II flippase